MTTYLEITPEQADTLYKDVDVYFRYKISDKKVFPYIWKSTWTEPTLYIKGAIDALDRQYAIQVTDEESI